MRVHRSLRVVLLVAVLTVTTLVTQVVVAISSADAQAVAAGATKSTGSTGGTLVFGAGAGLTNLDPLHAQNGGSSGGSETGAIYGYLVRYDATANKFVPYLAQSLTPNAAFTTWTMKLRPGMTFSDGSPFNAQAVVENVQRDLNPANPSTAGTDLALVSSVAATNDTTVTFTLRQPWAEFPYVLSIVPGLIAAPSYLAEVAAGNAQATPIGAGPFEVSSFLPGTSLTLVPNPHYALGAPHLSTLKFSYIPGGPSTLQAFQSGQLGAAVLLDAPSLVRAQQDKIPAVVSDAFDFHNELLMNNRSTSPLSNVKLREAVMLAFNPKVWNERINEGAPLASNLLFPKDSRWYTPNEQEVPHNLAKARKLVSEVEKETGWDGTLRLSAPNTNQSAGVVLEAMLKPVGITLDVSDSAPLVTWEINVVVKHDYDLATWGIDVVDGQPFFGLWANFVSPTNYGGYSDPAMNSAVNALGATTKTTAQKAAVKQFIATFMSTAPVVDMGSQNYRIVHQPNVHGLYLTTGASVLFDKASVS